MNVAQFLTAVKQAGGLAADVETAYLAGGGDLNDDLAVAEDVANMLAPFIPGAGIAAKLLPAVALLGPALELLNVSPGFGANLGVQSLGKIGAR